MTTAELFTRPRIKICGITNPQDAIIASQLGADAIGLVFYQASPRGVTVTQAQAIVQALPPFITVIGLFVNAEPAFVRAVLNQVALDRLQFHGEETAAYCASFHRPYIKAVRMQPDTDVNAIAKQYPHAQALLLDSYVKGMKGGTGVTFDWQHIPAQPLKPIILAGGLNPENITHAVNTVAPYGVDVSGGVEQAKGIKDAAKMAAFIRGIPMSIAHSVTSATDTPSEFETQPDASGHFGRYGGVFVAETLMQPLAELQQAYTHYRNDPEFQAELDRDLHHYVGRPSPIYHAERWSKQLGGAQIYLKREDLNHTGAHKINSALGQALLAKRMGKTRIIAETGAGQHGVASATVAARLGLECVVYMGTEDIKRQAVNVYRMRLLGAEVRGVESGSKTLKDALNEAMRDWVSNVDDTFYIIGTVAGPHPYPAMVRDFQAIIGREARAQMLEMTGRLPDALCACVGGGSNAIGLFYPFLNDPEVNIYGVEAAGEGLNTLRHAAPLSAGKSGVLHGTRTYLMMNEDGQISETHSISAGLDYPGVGPEHAWLKDVGRANYVAITDDEALKAFHILTRIEGIIPALESSHALAYCQKLAPTLRPDQSILVNLSGRGDKDINTVATLEDIHI